MVPGGDANPDHPELMEAGHLMYVCCFRRLKQHVFAATERRFLSQEKPLKV